MTARRKNPAAVTLGRRTSPRKRQSSKANGKLGGRRPKFAIGDRARANDKAPSDYRGRVGTIDEVGPGKSEFGLKYADGETPDRGHLRSWWLDNEGA